MRTTEEEKCFWYYGMADTVQPIAELIARSSVFPFKSQRIPPKSEIFSDRRIKVMSTIGQHRITTIYDDTLRQKVKDILLKHMIRWQCIDIVRLGFDDDDSLDHHPVVLVTVDTETVQIDEDSAQEAVDEIHAMMVNYDLQEVHAELKSGIYKQKVTYGRDQKIYPLDLEVVPHLGASIGPAHTDLAGTICIFVTIDGVKCAITCQHVATTSTTDIMPADETKIVILQPAEPDRKRREAILDDLIQGAQLEYKTLDDKKTIADQGEAPPMRRGELAWLASLQESIQGWTDEKAKMNKVSSPFGIVHCAPARTRHASNGCVRDWAVVRLSDERFQEVPPNTLPPSHFIDEEEHAIMEVYNRKIFPTNVMSEALSTVVLADEIEDILRASQIVDHQDHKSIRVFKFGRTSGFTAGSLNEIRSDCCFDLETTELCVINIPSLNNFSFGGDSGACVFDIKGRILGMLHSGNGQRQAFGAEVTYITPMEWVLNDIKETLQTDDVVIARGAEEEE